MSSIRNPYLTKRKRSEETSKTIAAVHSPSLETKRSRRAAPPQITRTPESTSRPILTTPIIRNPYAPQKRTNCSSARNDKKLERTPTTTSGETTSPMIQNNKHFACSRNPQVIRNPYAKKSCDRTSEPQCSSPAFTVLKETKQQHHGGSAVPIRNPYASTKQVATKKSAIDPRSSTSKWEQQPAQKQTTSTSPPGESAAALIISAADKAGMEGIDRAAIDAIILEISGNSAYMQQQRKRDAVLNERIAALRARLPTPLPVSFHHHQQQEWIGQRNPRSVIVVVDMDMFFMACELLRRPDITATTPAAVGGASMIMTSNYAARRYGVRSAMPGYIGAALVERLSGGKESLVFCRSNFELYKSKSAIVRDVLAEYDPHLSMLSLDEASLDISRYLLHRLENPTWSHEQISAAVCATDSSKDTMDKLIEFSNEDCLEQAADIVSHLRRSVCRATSGLTCSAGLAPNRLLAKIASDHKKPDGQFVVRPEHGSVVEFLHPLSIRKVSGIGRVTEKILKAFGITTVRELHEQPSLVSFLFDSSIKTTHFLLRASVGCSASGDGTGDSNEDYRQKGISRSRTFQPIPWSEVLNKIEDIGLLLANDMQEKKVKAKTITLKIKFDSFETVSRSKSSSNSVSTATEIIQTATELKQDMGHQTSRVRLVGIACNNLEDMGTANQTTIDQFLPPLQTRLATTIPTTGDNPYLSPLSTQKKTPPSIACPVCQQLFADAEAVSAHVDVCLNGRTVRSILNEASKLPPQKNKAKKNTLTHYFSKS